MLGKMSHYFVTLQHWTISRIGNSKNVRRHLVSLDAFVPFHDLFCVYWQSLVGIYYDAEKARICLQRDVFIISTIPQSVSLFFLYLPLYLYKSIRYIIIYMYVHIDTQS